VDVAELGRFDHRMRPLDECLGLVERSEVHPGARLGEQRPQAKERLRPCEIEPGERLERLGEAAGIAVLVRLGDDALQRVPARGNGPQEGRRGNRREHVPQICRKF
jgi:hypothetical protein